MYNSPFLTSLALPSIRTLPSPLHNRPPRALTCCTRNTFEPACCPPVANALPSLEQGPGRAVKYGAMKVCAEPHCGLGRRNGRRQWQRGAANAWRKGSGRTDERVLE